MKWLLENVGWALSPCGFLSRAARVLIPCWASAAIGGEILLVRRLRRFSQIIPNITTLRALASAGKYFGGTTDCTDDTDFNRRS
jgi:hypothetical protein